MWTYPNILPIKIGEKIKKNNAGFSLTEIILVLALASLLAGVGIQGLNYVSYGNTRKAAERLISRLDEVQMLSMTKDGFYMLGIFEKDDALYVQKFLVSPEDKKKGVYPSGTEVSVAEAEKIAGDSIELKWMKDGTMAVLEETELLLIGFSGETGAYLPAAEMEDSRIYDGDLWLTGRGSYHIVQVSETGKHYLSE